MDEEKDFSLDHIIMMAVAELEESAIDEIPQLYIDDRFKNYSIMLNDLQVGDMIYSIQSKLLPLLYKGHNRLNIVAIVDEDNPNIVDLGVSVEGSYVSQDLPGEERLAS